MNLQNYRLLKVIATVISISLILTGIIFITQESSKNTGPAQNLGSSFISYINSYTYIFVISFIIICLIIFLGFLHRNKTEEHSPERINRYQKFLVGPISFYYANHTQIEGFYNDLKLSKIESIEEETTSEFNGNTMGNIKAITISIGKKGTRKTTSKHAVSTPTSQGMFQIFLEEMITRNSVQTNLENIGIISLTKITNLENTIWDLRTNHNIMIDQPSVDKAINILKATAAESTLINLEQANGWFLIEGKFEIKAENDCYICVYKHPVNDYLSEQIIPITISISIPKSHKENTKEVFSQLVGVGRPLKIYGKILVPLSRKDGIWNVQIDPLAIY